MREAESHTLAGHGSAEAGQGAPRGLTRRALLATGLIGAAGAAAIPLASLAGDPRPAIAPRGVTAQKILLNTGWLFGGVYTPGSENPGYDDSRFAEVTLPHTVTKLSWRHWNPASWEKTWIYRRHIDGTVPPGSRVFLDFDGVMTSAAVFVNGQQVASHQGGYLPWSAELTGTLQPGDNLLAVIVDSRCLPVPPNKPGHPGAIDFLQPGGIYRDVHLRVVPQAYLADVFALPADVLTPRRHVDVRCTINAPGALPSAARITAELFDGDRRLAAASRTVPITAAGDTVTRLRLAGAGDSGLGGVSLWSPDNPALYTVRTTLSVPGTGTHTVRRRIGFREARFEVDGFYLNGERLAIFGLDRHQLFPYTGMAMPARVQRRDAEILRYDFNCNMVRCSHYPQSPHFLDACDELGLMVWEEVPGWHYVGDDSWQDIVVQNTRDMVVRDRSRPSVIIWGTRLNETKGHPALYHRTRQIAKALDGSRPSSGAMARHSTRAWDEDVFAYDDYHLDAEGNAVLMPPLPGVPYLVTESVGVDEHMPGRSHQVRPILVRRPGPPARTPARPAAPPSLPAAGKLRSDMGALLMPRTFRWTDPARVLARQAILHAQVHNIAQSDPRYAGLLGWCGFDYASLQDWHDHEHLKWAGVADTFRVPKPGAAIYQSQADPRVRPVVIPVFYWDFGAASPAGPGPNAMIATNCEHVEIFVGGVHHATGTPVLDAELYGHLAHPPTLVDLDIRRSDRPELRIEGYLGGKQVAEVRMSADPAGDHLGMAADDTEIIGDGSDATRVVFRALDAYGNQRRILTGAVTLTLDGPAELVGDNPFPFGEYGGLGAVWIRSRAGRYGPVTLTARHPRLGSATVQVTVTPANLDRIV
ncbi:MAG TPA: glycoside hydrolase family 2 TIM barrel-domain containing protein [Streptosporangiaceae bacterium]|nr:glycoside hydrolase family 2 TIM barrel-domain containing protein [Streptosporangiaceae bacterium]